MFQVSEICSSRLRPICLPDTSCIWCWSVPHGVLHHQLLSLSPTTHSWMLSSATGWYLLVPLTDSRSGWGWNDLCSQLVQPSCLGRAIQSQFPSIMSRWLLSISKDGESTTSLGQLVPVLGHCQSEKVLHMFRGILLCFRVYSLPLLLSAWLHPLQSSFSYL